MARDWRDDQIEKLEAQLRARDERIAELEQQGASLMKQIAELSAKVGQNSANSHLPPSTDSPEERRKRRNKNKERKRGAQKGHAGAHRELLPEEKVSKFVDLFPPECESCWEPLPKIPDASPQRHQYTEIPAVEPFTTEWRRHAVTCPCCDFRPRARYDESQIPASPFGPRLMAIMALLTGVYHLSRRKGVELLSDLLGIRVSLGALSAVKARVGDAVQPAVDAAWKQVRVGRLNWQNPPTLRGGWWRTAGERVAVATPHPPSSAARTRATASPRSCATSSAGSRSTRHPRRPI